MTTTDQTTTTAYAYDSNAHLLVQVLDVLQYGEDEDLGLTTARVRTDTGSEYTATLVEEDIHSADTALAARYAASEWAAEKYQR